MKSEIQCTICHSTDILKGKRYWSCKRCGHAMEKRKSEVEKKLAHSASRGNGKYRVPSLPVYRFLGDDE